MKSHSRVVIIGGGAMGAGLLYHLALEGWTDAVLVEKGELTSGSTWHAAGQCPQFVGSLSIAHINNYGTELYPKLEALTGVSATWHGCGGIRLALTDEEVNWFKYVHGLSKLVGYEMHLIGPEEIRQHHPFIETFGVKMGAMTVTDGHVDPSGVTNAMAKGARDLGAEIYRRTRVTETRRLPSGEWEVVTDKGTIICEHLVNAAGSYADIVGGWVGLKVPISNMLHHYIVTDPLPEIASLSKELPVVRDPYVNGYLRQEQQGLLIGLYEREGATDCFKDGISWDFESELLPPELDRLMPWLERAAERLPLFGQAGIRRIVPGAITHTPDGNLLLGPAPGLRNYWMACGASFGICQAAGAGKYLAQWMVHGAADINMAAVDPRRYGNWASGGYCLAKATDDYQNMYQLVVPGEYRLDGRPKRTSALYDLLKARGAQYMDVAGWERPRWFDKTGEGERPSYRHNNSFAPVREEAMAVRQRVGVMDMSSFSKFEVVGPDAEGMLNRLLANRMPRKVGGIVLTQWLTESGRIEGELTVCRLREDRFYLLSAAAAQFRDFDMLSQGRLPHENAEVRDVTEALGVLVLAGPRSRDVLAKLTDADLGNNAFRWLTGKEIAVAGVPARALRVNYVGELGWELHVPAERLVEVYEALLEAGRAYGIADFGAYAMNSLRLEKAYRGWGSEMTNEVNLIEADMERFVALDKPDFVGKAATLNAKQQGPRISLVYMSLSEGDAEAQGNEPIYADATLVGVTTSGGHGYAVGRSLAFGYVKPELAKPGTALEVEILGERRKALVEAQPLYDPENLRLRS
ncbi:FAD-dependent oxidoreductase [Rhodoligotrophos defluvii]|uniref:FAD-dependent oxidoreductase n=1 Tax=Rhodoligotrophos defluvii TaxID=2561934 RepID=UPI0010C97AE0|nr:FAD-dependent oxidoreductase [Rhodoligotrophos defluvii]